MILGVALLTAMAMPASVLPALAQTPEEIWKAEIAEGNIAWSKAPHAILKIQDAAYLGEGEASTLVGTPGKPESWHWAKGDKGALVARFAHGHASVTKDGKTLDETAIAKGIPVDKDVEIIGARTQVSAGVMGVRIMVFNQQAKAAKEFTGVDFFAYDPAYRVSAKFAPDPKRTARVFRTSRGTDKQFFHAGDATFTLQGKTITLPLYADDQKNIGDMSAFFTDGLTGLQTYGAGRYVDAEKFGAFPPKTITIDFNFAYNPNCARSPFFTCPVATDNIALDVKAGERDPHMKH
ncbi:MAG TPA: DUF1684 domain-containing protein [Rhizomicrobium sp.]|jgi:uncharacterized protein (DUF1684 family)